MQKKIKFLIVVLFAFFLLKWIPDIKQVFAEVCQCAQWCNDPYTCDTNNDGYDDGWCQDAHCCNTENCPVTCYPGEYPCNRDGNCCPIGQPTPTEVPNPTSDPNPSVPPPPPPGPCGVTVIPASFSMTVGQNPGTGVTASVSSGLGSATVLFMNFGSYNTSVATVSPMQDVSPPSYQTTVSAVAAGSTAIWATAYLSDGRSCQSSATTDADVIVTAVSCTIALSGTYSPVAGATVSVNPATTVSGGTITRVAFTVGNPTFATVCANGTGPCAIGSGSYTDLATAFNADLTGQGGGSTTLTATATMNTGATCTSNTSTVTVTNAPSWWQVVSGDIISGNTSGGTVQSTIPTTCILPTCSPFLIKNNPAGFSGVAQSATSGSGAINTGTGTVSPANWRATGAGFLGLEGYNYTYFKRKIPDGCSPQVLSGSSINASAFNSGGATGGACGNYYWYSYNSGTATTITGTVNLTNRKVIVFVEGSDLTLNSDINFNDGVGAFYLFASGDITIAPTVGDAAVSVPTPDIEGILFAGDQVIIPTNGTSNDLQLHIRGAVVGLGNGGTNDGIDPNRTLSINGLYPAEVFEFGPDLIMNWPSWLTRRTLQWREVAP